MPVSKDPQEAAKQILREGEIRGRLLTKAQRGYFGARAGGSPIKKKKKKQTR